jgi:hypothetical protein
MYLLSELLPATHNILYIIPSHSHCLSCKIKNNDKKILGTILRKNKISFQNQNFCEFFAALTGQIFEMRLAFCESCKQKYRSQSRFLQVLQKVGFLQIASANRKSANYWTMFIPLMTNGYDCARQIFNNYVNLISCFCTVRRN